MSGLGARLTLSALLAIAPALAYAASEHQADTSASTRAEAFRQVSFGELLGVASSPALTFPVAIPSHYRERRSANSARGGLVWAAPVDWNLIRQGRAASGRHGMLVVERSKSLRFDAKRREFRDGTGMSERNLAERLARHGAREVVIRRLDRDGMPMLLIETELERGEHLRVLYVQLGQRTRVLTYIGQTPWSTADEVVWGRVRDAIAAAVTDTMPR